MVYAGNHETVIGNLLAKWHRQKHPGSAFVPPFSAMGWAGADGRISASAVFCNYTGFNIDIHLVISRKPSIVIFRDICRYVFNELKCARLTANIPQSHSKIVRLTRGLGFHFEGSLPYFYGTGDGDTALVFGLYTRDARKILHGHESAKPASIRQHG